jgi:Putative bacterial sensory transduction regulator
MSAFFCDRRVAAILLSQILMLKREIDRGRFSTSLCKEADMAEPTVAGEKPHTAWADEVVIATASPPPKDAYIEHALTSLGIHYWRDDEGTLITVLEHPDTNNTLGCWFLAVGERGKTLQVLCTSVQTLPLSRVPKALKLLNTFHMESRIGRAFLHIDEEHHEARIYYDSLFDRTDGVLHAVLRIFLSASLASAITLLELTEKEKLYFPQLKNRLKSKRQEVTNL